MRVSSCNSGRKLPLIEVLAKLLRKEVIKEEDGLLSLEYGLDLDGL